MIGFVCRALLELLCAMTAPRPPVPNLPAVQPRPEPIPLGQQMCFWCWKEPARGGSEFCGQTCQAAWTATRNAVIPLEATPPTLPDGSPYRRIL